MPTRIQWLWGSQVVQLWYPCEPFMKEYPVNKRTLHLLELVRKSSRYWCSFGGGYTTTFSKIEVK